MAGERRAAGAAQDAAVGRGRRPVEDKRNRLQQKYYVERIDERDRAGGDRVDSKYFVLDYVHDPYSLPALEAYAQACFKDYPNLSQEIRALVQQLKGANQ
jgi:hypothetical protein